MLTLLAKADPASSAELSSLYASWHGLVLACALRITGSRADAEDVLQTLFVRLARRSDLTELQQNAGAYFYRATVNASLDLLRARERLRTLEPPQREGSGGPAPDQMLRAQELEAALRRALGALPPTGAEMFVLRYVEDMDPKQIATLLNTSVPVVAVTLFRARRQLQKRLAAFQGDRS